MHGAHVCVSITSWDADLTVSALPLPLSFSPTFIKHGSLVSLSGLFHNHYFKLNYSELAAGCYFILEGL